MSKNYEIVTNMTFRHEGDRSVMCGSKETVRMNRKELKELVDFWKRQGYEYMINKRRLVVMKSTTC